MAAVLLTEDQTRKLLNSVAEQVPAHGLARGGTVLRTYKEADGGIKYRLEFMALDLTNYKELVEPLMPKEIG